MTPPADDITGLLVDSANGFIAEHYGSRPPRLAIAESQRVDRDLWRQMAELGWLGLLVPEHHGGAGLTAVEAAALAEALGRGLVPEPVVAAALLPGALLAHCSDGCAAAERLAAAILGGERTVALAWQEAPGGLDIPLPATTLTAGRLRGDKCFVPAVEDDSLLVVSASAGGDTLLALVDADAPGVTLTPQAGGLTALAAVSFADTPVAAESVLLRGDSAHLALARALETGRVAGAAQLAGLASGVLAKTIAYVNERVQFERPIGSFQSVQHRCVDQRTAVLLANASWRHAARAWASDPDSPATLAAISAAKARCGDTALTAARTAVQLHGAMGFTEETGIGPYLRGAMQLAGWLGTATAHRRRFLALNPER